MQNQFYAKPCTKYYLFTMQYIFSYRQATKSKNNYKNKYILSILLFSICFIQCA